MKETMEQWFENMGKMWEPWQKLMGQIDPGQAPDSMLRVKWSTWMSALRSTHEVNLSWWKMFVDQTEEAFFKLYKGSPAHSQQAEDRIRELAATLRKASIAQQEAFKEYLDKMEELLKEKQQPS